MATRTNKYASVNFNHLYHKNSHSTAATTASSSAPSSSSAPISYKSHFSAARTTHGGMLVLTRPTPKPQPQLPSSQKQQTLPHNQPPPPAVQARPEPGSLASLPPGWAEIGSPPPSSPSKPDRFIPPHLRPGFVGREEKPGPEFQIRPHRQGNFGSPNRNGEERRPKSGGYERMRRGGESDQGELSRPRSSGTRPSSSGCFDSFGPALVWAYGLDVTTWLHLGFSMPSPKRLLIVTSISELLGLLGWISMNDFIRAMLHKSSK